MGELPTGTVTFVFTDIEGSTSMLQRLGNEFAAVIEAHNDLVRAAFDAGVEIRSQGDAFFYVFVSAPDAVRAACAAQRLLADHSWPEGGTVMVRMGIHTGEGVEGGDDYIGLDVHRAARIAAAGHGGQILLSDATRALVRAATTAEMTLLDLGEHRFKDLDHPEHVYQIAVRGLPTDFPPIRSLDAAPNNLPAQPTAFVGRDHEVAEVTDLIRGSRLVTLTGPGGAGKTRLAVHVASQVLAEFADGVFSVPLASVRDPALVVPAIAAQLGVPDEGEDSLLRATVGHLGSRHVLLLLDNFEHLMDAAPEVAALLAGASGVRVLVTSQSPLRLRGERIYPVPPLAVAEGVDLFAALVAASDPSFQITAQNRSTLEDVVVRLEGLPLALELTAPRVRLFGLSGLRDRLVERLDVPTADYADLPERHRSLAAAIAWSYDLLDADQQALLRQLAIFDGGFTLDAAEAVVDPEPAPGVVEGVASLLDRSLLRHRVQQGETRFSMLEAIRQFAGDALVEAGDDQAVARRHAEYFAGLAETVRPLLEGEGQQVWLDRLADEHDNIRAVLRWSRDSTQPDFGLRTAGSAWRFFFRRGHLPEARAWLEELLDLPGASLEARASGLDGLAGVAYWQRDFEGAMSAYGELIGLYRTLGDQLRVADTLFGMSTTAAWMGDFERALVLAEEARAAYDQVGVKHGSARVSAAIAFATWQAGRLEEALDLWRKARAEYDAAGDWAEVLQTDAAIAAVLYQLGRTDEAVGCALQVLEAVSDGADEPGIVMSLDFVAAVTAARYPEDAVRVAAAADRRRTELGGGVTAEGVGLETTRSIAARTMEAEGIDTAWAEGAAMDLEQAVALARKVAKAALS